MTAPTPILAGSSTWPTYETRQFRALPESVASPLQPGRHTRVEQTVLTIWHIHEAEVSDHSASGTYGAGAFAGTPGAHSNSASNLPTSALCWLGLVWVLSKGIV